MSDWRAAQADLTFTLPGEEWWYFVAAINTHYEGVRATPRLSSGAFGPGVWVGEHQAGHEVATARGEMAFAPADGYTQVYVTFAAHTGEGAAFWDGVQTFLEIFARQARFIRQTAGRGWTPAEAIEYYYRSRARGSKMTLKQAAELAGINYEVLKKHKQRYDAAGKWGSKKGQHIPEHSP